MKENTKWLWIVGGIVLFFLLSQSKKTGNVGFFNTTGLGDFMFGGGWIILIGVGLIVMFMIFKK